MCLPSLLHFLHHILIVRSPLTFLSCPLFSQVSALEECEAATQAVADAAVQELTQGKLDRQALISRSSRAPRRIFRSLVLAVLAANRFSRFAQSPGSTFGTPCAKDARAEFRHRRALSRRGGGAQHLGFSLSSDAHGDLIYLAPSDVLPSLFTSSTSPSRPPLDPLSVVEEEQHQTSEEEEGDMTESRLGMREEEGTGSRKEKEEEDGRDGSAHDQDVLEGARRFLGEELWDLVVGSDWRDSRFLPVWTRSSPYRLSRRGRSSVPRGDWEEMDVEIGPNVSRSIQDLDTSTGTERVVKSEASAVMSGVREGDALRRFSRLLRSDLLSSEATEDIVALAVDGVTALVEVGQRASHAAEWSLSRASELARSLDEASTKRDEYHRQLDLAQVRDNTA